MASFQNLPGVVVRLLHNPESNYLSSLNSYPMKNAIFSILALLLTTTAFAQVDTRSYLDDPALVPRERVVDFSHLKLEVAFDAPAGKVMGTVTHTFTALRKEVSEIVLDAVRINVKAAKLNGEPVKFVSSDKDLRILPPKTLTWDGTEHVLEITYDATPRKGLYFIGWNDAKNLSRKQLWTQGQGIDNRHWIPMYDLQHEKAVTELLISFDSRYKVLSNGALVKHKANKDGTDLWHYKISHPHASYLIMLGVGEYEIETRKSASGVPIHLWYYPGEEHKIEPTYRYSVEMFDWFEKEIGVPYPWGSYSQIPVQDFMFGAMENTTATLFGDFYYVDERGFADKPYVRVNAHELAHQWFGDMVTARTGTHHWLHESFATHYDLTYQGIAHGTDHYNWVRRKANDDALKASKKDFKPIAHSKAGVVRHYPKGAFVLQMLKYVVGREEFNRAIKHYLEKHAYDVVDSEDLLVAFHESQGVSLDWFWEQWVYRGGEPHYKVGFAEGTNDGQRVGTFNVTQTHETNDVVGLFKMPIWFEVHYTDGSKTAVQTMIEEQHHEVKVQLEEGKTVDFALFDPNNQVMKAVEFDKSPKMWVSQAENAEHMLDRYDALVALRSMAIGKKRTLLTKLFKSETFHLTRAEIVHQVIEDEQSILLLVEAMNSNDPLVNQAVVNHDKPLNSGLINEAGVLLSSEKSYWTVEKALTKLCREFPNHTATWLELTKDEVGFRGRNIRTTWLGLAYASAPNHNYIAELIDYVGGSYDFDTRKNAAKVLQKLNYCNETLVLNLCDAIGSSNSRLSGPCGKVLQHFAYSLQSSDMVRAAVRKFEADGAAEWKMNKIRRYL